MKAIARILVAALLVSGCAGTLTHTDNPHKFGAAAVRVPVVNGTATPLPSYQFANMAVGTIIADTTGQNWQLTTSSATVNHTTVEACAGNPQFRWLTYTGGGGGGTVQTAAPVSGDGSLGNKITIAPAALPLSAVATQSANSFVANCTGSTASPAACSGSSLNGAMVGAGAAPSWVLSRRVAAQALSATLTSEWYTDLATSADWALMNDSGGGGTATGSLTVNGGVVQASTNGQSGHSSWVSPAGRYPLVSDLSNTPFYAYWRVRFEGPSGANAQVFVVVGNWTAGPAFVSQFSFGIDGTFQTNGSNTNFCVRLYNGTTNTVTATSTAIDTASYHDVEMQGDGTTVTIKYDGVAVNQTLTQSGIGAGKNGTIGTAMFGNDTTSRLIDVDKMYIAFAAQ